ncbi:MAG TPA: ABC transporter permease [Candidatus Acidoferrales bacterium]|nr:ABC transporter permease [Candidatus Acidoferrales bacterium]
MTTSIPANAQPFEDEEALVYSKVTFWTRLRRHKLALVGLVILAIIMLCALLAPLLAPFDPNAIDNVHWQGEVLPPCFVSTVLCGGHVLGTDAIGRDELSRLLFGARVSLEVGIFTVLFEVMIGIVIGAISGFFGGWVDWLLMRLTDVFLSIPLLPLLLVLTAIAFASKTNVEVHVFALTLKLSNAAALSFWVIVLIIGFLSWPTVARLVRASFLVLREREFTEAARAIGAGNLRIMFRHLLPNAVAPIIVQATLDVANIIVLESTLSFLGFGIQPPTASWGNMLNDAQANIQNPNAVWAAALPAFCILLTVLSINFIGDGLRDALDPNMK